MKKLPSFQLIISLICFFCLSEYSVWKDSCVDVTGKFPPPFSSATSGTIHRSCREAAGEGGERGGGRAGRREAAWKRLSSWSITEALGFHCPSLPTFAVTTPCPSIGGSPHFHHMIHCPWTVLQAGLVLMSCVSGDMFKNRYIWLGVSILGLVLSLATQNGMRKHGEWGPMSSAQEEHWLEVWKRWVLSLSQGPWPCLWSSVILSLFICKMDPGGIRIIYKTLPTWWFYH